MRPRRKRRFTRDLAAGRREAAKDQGSRGTPWPLCKDRASYVPVSVDDRGERRPRRRRDQGQGRALVCLQSGHQPAQWPHRKPRGGDGDLEAAIPDHRRAHWQRLRRCGDPPGVSSDEDLVARLQARDEILVTRDAGRIAAAPQALPVGAPVIWDGRFEVAVAAAGLSVRPLGGLMSRLETNERAALALIPAPARPALPAVIDADGNVTCPILAQGPWSSARTLVFGRLAASCGQIAREPALAPGPHGERDPGALS